MKPVRRQVRWLVLLLALTPVAFAGQATMTERTYDALSQAHELLRNGDPEAALGRLARLERRALNDYEQALVHQTFGFVHVEQGDYERALGRFEQCLELNALPPHAQYGMLYSLAGLYMARERYQDAVDTLMRWQLAVEDPPPEGFVMMAQALAQLDRHRDAVGWIERAVSGAGTPDASWYQLWLASLNELGDYRAMIAVLRKMVANWPDRLDYWEMLSGAHMQLDEDVSALAALELAYKVGVLGDENKLLNLARVRMYAGSPYTAARLIKKEMSAGRIRTNERNLELLLSAWTSAREYDEAIAVIDQLAPLKQNGELYLRQAQLYNAKSEWAAVEDAARKALSRGGLGRPGDAYLLIGVAASEQQRFEDALQAFEDARRFAATRQAADGWIAFLIEQVRARAIAGA